MKRGNAVKVRMDDGEVVKGQVWDEAEPEGSFWVALESGQYVRVGVNGRDAYSESGARVGRVAA